MFPSSYNLPPEARAVNGSSITANCSHLVTDNDKDTTTYQDPRSSVLFDRIHTLRLDRKRTWASQLLTINSSMARITFDFTRTPGFVRVERIVLVLFNCPEWGISVQSVQLLANGGVVGIINLRVTSCDSLVSV